jgi:SAM-dependent methyltransferase
MKSQRPLMWRQRPAGRRTRADLIVNEVPDGLAVFDWRCDRVHYLNNTAALIFCLSNGTNDEITIANLVGKAFVLPRVPISETAKCLEDFRQKGLLERKWYIPGRHWLTACRYFGHRFGRNRYVARDWQIQGRPLLSFRRLLSGIFHQTRRALGLDYSFSPPGPSSVPIDIFITAVEKDIAMLKRCVVHARENILHPIGGIYVVAPRDSAPIQEVARQLNCSFISEDSVIALTKDTIEYRVDGRDRSGWLLQQLLKLSADRVCQNRYILILDSDTCFLGPRVFLHNDRPLFDLSAEYHETYFAMNQRLLGLQRRISRSFITHYMLFDAEVLERLRSDIERKWERPWYQAILDCKDNKEALCFSEYELYGDYYRRHGPKRPILNSWSNKSQLFISDDHISWVIERAYRSYRSVSFHNYLAQDVFSEVYAKGVWANTEEFDSRGGSTDGFPDSDIEFARELIARTGARRGVDVGCGNFQAASGFVDCLDSYVGIDIVPSVIESNTAKFGRPGVSFMALDAAVSELPDADICFVRHVLQHLSNREIAGILARCSKFQLVVITEYWPAPSELGRPNLDMAHGSETRAEFGSWVDIRAAPFSCTRTSESLVVPYSNGTICTLLWRPESKLTASDVEPGSFEPLPFDLLHVEWVAPSNAQIREDQRPFME